MNARARSFATVIAIACWCVSVRAVEYPLLLTLDAAATTATAAMSSIVTVRVNRLMEESRRTRVTDALRYNGYGNFLTVLRSLPPVGEIELQGRKVEIKYARETEDGAGRRIVLIADHPLFFLTVDPSKSRTGFELTMVDLRVDAKGVVTGTMTGAARVKPSPDGPVIDDFAEAPVRLAVRSDRK
jgi:hypothetical protein